MDLVLRVRTLIQQETGGPLLNRIKGGRRRSLSQRGLAAAGLGCQSIGRTLHQTILIGVYCVPLGYPRARRKRSFSASTAGSEGGQKTEGPGVRSWVQL